MTIELAQVTSDESAGEASSSPIAVPAGDVAGEPAGPPDRWVELMVLAQDPTVLVDGRMLRAKVRVPLERLEPGPRGHRFHVVDLDVAHAGRIPGHELRLKDQGVYLAATDQELVEDPVFRAQNSYAIAARTLDAFECALGRRIPWRDGAHQMFIVPAAFREANAFYDADSHAILFGYVDDGAGARAYNALSHDIVAHETTHAVLDGLRSRFEEPGLPDQAAFHEAFADIVALLSVFALPGIAAQLVSTESAGTLIDSGELSPEKLRGTALLGLGEQLGRILGGSYAGPQRGVALRRSVEMDPDPSWMTRREYEEPHRRGEILVAAVTQAFLRMWSDRLELLRAGGRKISRELAADEGAKAAEHLLRMSIRAIDFTPPLEFAFTDFLDAILTADAEVAPDDEHGYRRALREAFGRFGMEQPAGGIGRVVASEPLQYSALHADELRTSADEVYRFIWDNAVALGIPVDQYLEVDHVWSSTRVGPDGFVVREIVATYVQMLDATVDELIARAARQRAQFAGPAGLAGSTAVRIFGGGVLVFDEWGRAKYHGAKPLHDWRRQQERLEYLVRNGLVDSRGRFGFSYGLPEGQRFAILHEPGTDIEERW